MLHEFDDLNTNDLTDSSQNNWSFPDFSKFSNKKIKSRLGRRNSSRNDQKEMASKSDSKNNSASNDLSWSQLSGADKFEEHPLNYCVTHPVSSATGLRSVPNQFVKSPSNQNTLKDIGNIVKGCTKVHDFKIVDSSDDSSKENIKYILNNSFLGDDSTKTESSCMSELSLNSSENNHVYGTLPFKTSVKSFYNDHYLRTYTPNPLEGILDTESDSSFDEPNRCSKSHFISFESEFLKTSFSGRNTSDIKIQEKSSEPLVENVSSSNIIPNVSQLPSDKNSQVVVNKSQPSEPLENVSSNSFLTSVSQLQSDKNNQVVLHKSQPPAEPLVKNVSPYNSLPSVSKLPFDKNGQIVVYKSTPEPLFDNVSSNNFLPDVSKLPSNKNSQVVLNKAQTSVPLVENIPYILQSDPKLPSSDNNVQLVVYKKPSEITEGDKSGSDKNDKVQIESPQVVPPSEAISIFNENIIQKKIQNFNTNKDVLAQQNPLSSSCPNINSKVIPNSQLTVDNKESKPVQPSRSFLNKSENNQNDILSNVLFNKHIKTSNDKFSKQPWHKPMVPVGASVKSTLQEARIDSLVPPRVLHLNQTEPPKSLLHNSVPNVDPLQPSFDSRCKTDKVIEPLVKPNSISSGNKINPVSLKPEYGKILKPQGERSSSAYLFSRPTPPDGIQSSERPQVVYNLPKAIQVSMISNGLISNGSNSQEQVTPAQKLSAVKLSHPFSQEPNSNDVFKKPFAVPPTPAERVPIKTNNKPPLNVLQPKDEKSLVPGRPQDIVVNGTTYTVLSMLGRGGSSVVYQVMDPKTSELMAVKCVDLSSVDGAIANGYLNEVDLLEKLQGCQSVIKMFNYEYVKENKLLYVVMERGDTDLAKLIKDITKTKKMSISMIIFYWTEMLSAVKDIHERGIIHSDLKPANFLLVSGRLKLIDFGIASSLQGDMTSVIKDSTAGTFNYMSPEAINSNSEIQGSHKISYKSDIWSLGCILYSLLFGRSPYSHIAHMWSKLRAIIDPSCHPPYPTDSEVQIPFIMNLALRWCLLKDPKRRPTVDQLLRLPYCDPPVSEERRLKIKSEIHSCVVEMFPECTFDFV